MHPLGPFLSTNLALYFHEVPSIEWFRSTLEAVRSVYRFISIQDVEVYFYEDKKFNNCCLITFDDGCRSFYERAFPVLKEMNVPAVIFVSPKIIGKGLNYWFQELRCIKTLLGDTLIKEAVCAATNCDIANIGKYDIFSIFKRLKIKDILCIVESIKEKHKISVDRNCNITESELRGLRSSGLISIGAHTMNHPILSNETDQDAEWEIRESVRELSQMINEEVRYFAYPNGKAGLDYSEREQLALQENGVKLAFTTHTGFFDTKMNPLAIPRGGFSGVKKEESTTWVLARLLLIPIWDKIRRGVEEKERCELKSMSFP